MSTNYSAPLLPPEQDSATGGRKSARRYSHSDLLELYRIGLDEYRFQTTLNWNRSQYYLVLNIGILGIATGIVQLSKGATSILVAGLFFVGLICCLLSLAASRVQREYYVSARKHKGLLESKLRLGELSITRTVGMGSTMRRLGRVTTFLNVMLSVVAVIDLVGATVVIAARL
jgi:hypothetical protein